MVHFSRTIICHYLLSSAIRQGETETLHILKVIFPLSLLICRHFYSFDYHDCCTFFVLSDNTRVLQLLLVRSIIKSLACSSSFEQASLTSMYDSLAWRSETLHPRASIPKRNGIKSAQLATLRHAYWMKTFSVQEYPQEIEARHVTKTFDEIQSSKIDGSG